MRKEQLFVHRVNLSFWIVLAATGCQTLLTEAEVVHPDSETSSGIADPCDDYCAAVQETCDGSSVQYSSTQLCENVCKTLDRGDEEDESGNTASCRLHYALESAEDPDTYCTAAGPGGNGVCGSNCESFCGIQEAVCVGENQQYNSITECISACVAFDASVPYSAEVLSGDSLACRLNHLTLASGSPKVHCPHIASLSAVCF